VSVGLYVPGTTPAHRMPAGGKLAALAGLGVLLFAVPTPPVVGASLMAVLVAALAVARLPVALLVRQARAVLWWVAAVAVLQVVLAGVLPAVVTAGRLLALVLAAAVVTATPRVTAMVRVVERICAPLRRFGVRPARIGLVLAMALRFLPLLTERADRIREAQAARGGTGRGPRALVRLLVPLLVQVLQLAGTVSEALDARGADDVPHPAAPVRGHRPVETDRGR
jgi:biotin transport system permease protein